MLRGTVGHALRRFDRKQEIIQSAYTVSGGVLTAQSFTQRGKGRNRPCAQRVQRHQFCAHTVIYGQTVAVRMLDPVALPCAAADVPRQNIVFQPVDLVARQVCQSSL